MKKMILILFIILMTAMLLPSAVFAEEAKKAEETSQDKIGWAPFALPKDQKIPSYAPSGTNPPAIDKAETDKPADKDPQDIMDEIIARSQGGAPVKLLSIAVIPYIPEGRPLPCK